LEDRDIISVLPRLQTKLGQVDMLYLQAQFDKVSYQETELLNSSRDVVELGDLHHISEVDSIGASVKFSTIDFDHIDAAAYETTSWELYYQASLRKMSYRFMLGASRAELSNDESFDTPIYSFDANYTSGKSQWRVNLQRSISDTSFGNGNSSAVEFDNNNSDSIARGAQQLDRKSASLNLDIKDVCDRCAVSFGALISRDTQLSNDVDTSQFGWQSTFNYQLSRRGSISLSFSSFLQEYELEKNTKYKTKNFSVEYRYQFLSGFGLSLFSRKERRKDIVIDLGYVERYSGLSINYSF
jgi:hypothetical protein